MAKLDGTGYLVAQGRRGVLGALTALGLGLVAAVALLFTLLRPSSPAVALPLPAPAAAAGVTLAVTPASMSVAPGADFELTLQVETGAQTVDVVQVDVSFPPALLQVIDAETATSGVQIKGGTRLPTRLQNVVDNAAGRIQYAAGVALTSDARASGSFVLATVQFQAKAAGTAAVQFSPETGAASTGERLTVSTSNGVVRIQAPPGGGGGGSGSSPPQPTATPPPAAATVPAPPQVQGPAGGIVLPDLAPVLRWQQPAGVTQFQVRVVPFNLDGPGINLIIGAPALVGQSQFQVAAPDLVARTNFVMLPGMSYRWQVRVATAPRPLNEDAPEWSAWVQGDFITPPPSSSTISAVSPQPGTGVNTLTPRLTWANSDPSIFYYEIQVSKDLTFTAEPERATAAVYWELVHGGVTTPVNSYAVPPAFPLEPDSGYYWRVRPRVQGDGAPVAWSASWTFRSP